MHVCVCVLAYIIMAKLMARSAPPVLVSRHPPPKETEGRITTTRQQQQPQRGPRLPHNNNNKGRHRPPPPLKNVRLAHWVQWLRLSRLLLPQQGGALLVEMLQAISCGRLHILLAIRAFVHFSFFSYVVGLLVGIIHTCGKPCLRDITYHC